MPLFLLVALQIPLIEPLYGKLATVLVYATVSLADLLGPWRLIYLFSSKWNMPFYHFHVNLQSRYTEIS